MFSRVQNLLTFMTIGIHNYFIFCFISFTIYRDNSHSRQKLWNSHYDANSDAGHVLRPYSNNPSIDSAIDGQSTPTAKAQRLQADLNISPIL